MRKSSEERGSGSRLLSDSRGVKRFGQALEVSLNEASTAGVIRTELDRRSEELEQRADHDGRLVS